MNNQKHLPVAQLKVTRMAEFMLETNCLSQTDNLANINSLLRRIRRRLVRLLDRKFFGCSFHIRGTGFYSFARFPGMPI